MWLRILTTLGPRLVLHCFVMATVFNIAGGQETSAPATVPVSPRFEAVLVQANQNVDLSQLRDATSLKQALTQNYNRDVPPGFSTEKTTEVFVGVQVLDIHGISDSLMEFALEALIHRQWVDPRLVFPNVTGLTEISFREEELENIWRPDLYMNNEREGSFHVTTRPNDAAFLHNDGTVFYTSRITELLACPMDLHSYPLDVQFCQLRLGSYTHDLNDVLLKWRIDTADPIRVDDSITLNEYEIGKVVAETCSGFELDIGIGDKQVYPCVQGYITFTRNYGVYMIQLFVPTSAVVSITWISFWMSPESVPGRVGICATGVLTIFTQIFFMGLQLPQVSFHLKTKISRHKM